MARMEFQDIAFQDWQNSPWSVLWLGLLIPAVLILHRLLLSPLIYGDLSHVPGPKLAALSWYYLSYFDLQYRRNQVISEWHRKYGPVVRIRPNEISLANPIDYKEIYDSKSKYAKTKYFKRFQLYGQDNLFSTELYSEHQKLKRTVAGAYAKSNIVANAQAMIQERVSTFTKQVHLEKIQSGTSIVDFFVLFDCFSHDIMTRFLYGPSHGTDAISSPLDRPLVVNLKRSQIWTPLWVNFGQLKIPKFLLPKEYQQNFEYGAEVAKHVEGLMEAHDMDETRDEQFSVYRYMRKSEGWLSREQMASEMFDDLKAGQMTTASTLTYIAWRLSKHPEWQRRLQDALNSLKRDEDGGFAARDLEECRVLDAIIKETMRLHPAASGRQERVVPSGGRQYSEIFIPEGTTVVGSTLMLHHNSEAYPFSEEWMPERWLNADEESLKWMTFCWVAFGHGARVCIGQHLAMLEIRTLIATIYTSFSTALSETSTDHEMHQLGTLAAVPRGLRCELRVIEK